MPWTKNVLKKLEEVGITIEGINLLSNDQIIKKVREWDNMKWKSIVEEKTTLKVYAACKGKVNEEIWFKMDSNTL